jgi:predicted amidohydrolase
MVMIAVAQVEINDNLAKNVIKTLNFIDKAASNNADIVCFPESCLGEDFLNIKCNELKQIQKKCKEKRIYCILGAHIKEFNKIYNSAILINRKGKIQYIYRKKHLFPGLDLEETYPGKSTQVIKTDFGTIGIIICWDFAFPEDIKKLSKKGAQILFCPSYLLNDAKIGKDVLRSYPLTRAFENLSYFISCDAFTDEVLCESYICSPHKILNQIKNKEGIIFSELDLKKIENFRQSYNCLSHSEKVKNTD